MKLKYPVLLITLGIFPTAIALGQFVRQVAVPYERPANAPGASDVQMRSLRFRPINGGDPHDTFKALDDFHVTRLEWTYLNSYMPGNEDTRGLADELENIQRVKASGRIFGGAANGSTGTVVRKSVETGRIIKRYTIVDRNGYPVAEPHMRYWENPNSPGCANNPAYRQGQLEYIQKLIEAGATTIQRDGPSAQIKHAQKGTGCFCEYCMAAFGDYLRDNVPATELKKLGVSDVTDFNYKEYLNAISPPPDTGQFDWDDWKTVKSIGGKLHQYFEQFQLQSCVDFYSWLRTQLKMTTLGTQVALSCNNTSWQNWEDPYILIFDYCISEMIIKSANPAHIYDRAQVARKHGKVQVFGTPKTMGVEIDEAELVRLKQQVIATAYASGAIASVPWDVFMQSDDGKDRFFGKPENFAQLFGFVRANDKYLTGYCTAGGKGPGFIDNPYSDGFPVEVSRPDVSVILRALPENKSSPVVVHIVDWTNGPAKPTTLRMKSDAFFPGGNLRVILRFPKEYDAGEHAAAEAAAQTMRHEGNMLGAAQAAAYEPLVEEVILHTIPAGEWTQVTLPALDPWGMLIISSD